MLIAYIEDSSFLNGWMTSSDRELTDGQMLGYIDLEQEFAVELSKKRYLSPCLAHLDLMAVEV